MNLINTKLKGFNIDDSAYERLGASEEYEIHQESFTVFSRCVDKNILQVRAESRERAVQHTRAAPCSFPP